MCLIVVHGHGISLTDAELDATFGHNADGLGIAIVPAQGKIEVAKYLPKNALTSREVYREACAQLNPGDHIVAHWRFATHGKVNLANVHPFYVPDSDAVIAHNGVIHGYGSATKSDTRDWIDTELVALVREHKIEPKDYAGSRLAVMWPGYGETTGYVEMLGGWETLRTGLWVSNTYSLEPVKTRTWKEWSGNYFDRDDRQDDTGIGLAVDYVQNILESAQMWMEMGEDPDVVIEAMHEGDPEIEVELQALAWRLSRLPTKVKVKVKAPVDGSGETA